MELGDNLENIRMLDAKVGNRKIFMLWPGVAALLFLFVLLFVALRMDPSSGNTGAAGQLWSTYGFLVTLYIIAGVVLFAVSRTGPDISISSMTPDEQARVNADCVTGYRFGDVIICRDCLLIPTAGSRVSAVHFRDLLWIYADKKWIRYATRKNGMINMAPRKDKFFPKNLGPRLDEDGFYRVMQQFLPWCFYGKTPEVNTMFRKNFPQLIRTVDERRAAFYASQAPTASGNMFNEQTIIS